MKSALEGAFHHRIMAVLPDRASTVAPCRFWCAASLRVTITVRIAVGLFNSERQSGRRGRQVMKQRFGLTPFHTI